MSDSAASCIKSGQKYGLKRDLNFIIKLLTTDV